MGLKEDSTYLESDLETAIIDKLEHFMLELGKGFLFEGRQRTFFPRYKAYKNCCPYEYSKKIIYKKFNTNFFRTLKVLWQYNISYLTSLADLESKIDDFKSINIQINLLER